jgi:hypothetical protein
MKTALALAIVLGMMSAAPPAEASGFGPVLDTDTARGRHKTVVVEATHTLRETTSTETAFVVIVATMRPQTLDGLSAVRCIDATGTYTLEADFTLRSGQAAILPTDPTGIHQTYPRRCIAYVQLTSRKRGWIQADLGIWVESLSRPVLEGSLMNKQISRITMQAVQL